MVPEESARQKLESGEYECVVIYDEKGITKTAKLVYKTISNTCPKTRVAILKGLLNSRFSLFHGSHYL